MSLTDQIYAQALLMAGELEPRRDTLLRSLCRGASTSLAARLRKGLTPEDCKADFIAAASLFALAALSEIDSGTQPESFTAGDVTVHRGSGSAAANCLRYQANLMIAPYVHDTFAFLGV